MTATLDATAHGTGPETARRVLVLGALGVVFGDIGTSPLYALKESAAVAAFSRRTLCWGSCP